MKTTGMKRLILALLAGILCPCYALCDTKIEAESAAYVNCKLITDSKYSGGKALELTESNAKITFTHMLLNVESAMSMWATTGSTAVRR